MLDNFNSDSRAETNAQLEEILAAAEALGLDASGIEDEIRARQDAVDAAREEAAAADYAAQSAIVMTPEEAMAAARQGNADAAQSARGAATAQEAARRGNAEASDEAVADRRNEEIMNTASSVAKAIINATPAGDVLAFASLVLGPTEAKAAENIPTNKANASTPTSNWSEMEKKSMDDYNKYMNGSGPRKMNDTEIAVGKEILGDCIDYDKITIQIIPDNKTASSFPNGKITTYDVTTISGADAIRNKEYSAHELYHQVEYNNGTQNQPLSQLMGEQLQYQASKLKIAKDPYDYGGIDNLDQGGQIDQIPTLEGRAEFVGDFALSYYTYKQIQQNADNAINPNVKKALEKDANKKKEDTKPYAKILENSGYESPAIKKIF